MKNPRKPLHGDRPEVGQLPVDEDVRREVAFHIDMRASELEAEGWDPAAARAEAERVFGNRQRIEKEARDVTHSTDRAVRRAHAFDALRQDLKYAFRTLGRSPAFTVVAVLTLALGIGANAAIFSVVNGVLLKPLPYRDSGSIVFVQEEQPERGRTMSVASQNFRDWREQATSLAALAAYAGGQTVILGSERPYRTGYAAVSEDFWSVFRPRPVVGRLLTPEEHAVENGPVAVVIREDLWRSVYNEQPLDQIDLEVVGSSPTVVGVLPESFDYPAGTRIWGTFTDTNSSRSAHNYRVVGRMKPGTSLAQVDAELDAIQARLTGELPPDDFIATGTRSTLLRESIAGDASGPLIMLLGAAGLVLLVACTNLASTLLARGTVRIKEIAVRSALGAERRRVVRQLFTESLVLAGLGATAGLGLAWLVVRLLRSGELATTLPRLDEVGLDPAVIAFTALVAALTAVLFGLLPAFRQTRTEVATTLRSGGRQNSRRAGTRVWALLVASEVALAFVLLSGSGLLIRSFQAVLETDRGFDTEGVMTAGITLDRSEYGDRQAHRAFYDELLPRLEARPEIGAVGLVTRAPTMGAANGRIELDGDLSKQAVAVYLNASEGYFEAIGIPLLSGRLFDERDREDTEHVALVSKSFAEEHWPGEDAVGHTITGGGMDSFWQERRFARVIGVVGDARYQTLERETGPTVYFPYTQRPQRLQFAATVVARPTAGDASATVAPIREELRALSPDALPQFSSMDELVGDAVAERAFTMNLLSSFAGIALVLAVVGIYGVVSYTVSRRTREMGIRLALGAEPRAVGRLVQKGAMRPVLLGAVVGLGASLAMGGLIEGLLFGVEPIDPLTQTLVAASLVLPAWLAAMIPARRATRVDPLVTMQAE